MALLWKNAAAHQVEAMAWADHGGMDAEKAGAKPVKKAGFAGFVGESEDQRSDKGMDDDEDDAFDEDAWDNTSPEPTKDEQDHYDEHDEYPDSHHERHEQAYAQEKDRQHAESDPDHEDDELHDFVGNHGSNTSLWQSKATLGKVDLTKGVYATQSHVGQVHIDRYRHNPGDSSWHTHQYGQGSGGDYLAHDTPMFVTHQGRLHVTDGHHRVGAALQDGKPDIHAWHYDADKHGLPGDEDDD